MLSSTALGVPRFSTTSERPSSSTRRSSLPKFARALMILTMQLGDGSSENRCEGRAGRGAKRLSWRLSRLILRTPCAPHSCSPSPPATAQRLRPPPLSVFDRHHMLVVTDAAIDDALL